MGLYKRPSNFQKIGSGPPYSLWEFNAEMDSKCRTTTWAGYRNQKHPWVVAALSYKIAVGAATQGGLSLFKIPDDVPSGKYGNKLLGIRVLRLGWGAVLHWWWRRYLNCLDVDVVVKSKQVRAIN